MGELKLVETKFIGAQSIDLEIRNLKREVLPQVRILSEVKQIKTLGALVFNWSMIVGSVFVSKVSGHFYVYVFSLLVISSRQHGLVILMHEGVHQRLMKKNWLNDFISDWLIAYPIIMKTSIYRRHHLLHHRNLNTAQDPDWARKSTLPEWQFPVTLKKFLKTYSKYLIGYGIYENFKLCQYLSGLNTQNLRTKEAMYELKSQIIFYSLVVFGCSYLKAWNLLFFYWVIPAMTIFPIIMKIRSIAEHFGLSRQHELNETRNIHSHWFERFFVVPFNVSYHLDHHLFPTVPFYNLPKLNKILAQHEVYRGNAHQNSSYLGLSKTALGKDLFSRPNL